MADELILDAAVFIVRHPLIFAGSVLALAAAPLAYAYLSQRDFDRKYCTVVINPQTRSSTYRGNCPQVDSSTTPVNTTYRV